MKYKEAVAKNLHKKVISNTRKLLKVSHKMGLVKNRDSLKYKYFLKKYEKYVVKVVHLRVDYENMMKN